MFITGLNECRGDQLTKISLPTDLQSEVLLPCFFESDFLNSNQTNKSCVVWTHLNSTNREIVEIGLDGEAKFWNNRLGRIKTFPKLPESELLNFSIQIRNVQQSDLGVYHCTLFRETGCLLAYKRIELHNGKLRLHFANEWCISNLKRQKFTFTDFYTLPVSCWWNDLPNWIWASESLAIPSIYTWHSNTSNSIFKLLVFFSFISQVHPYI